MQNFHSILFVSEGLTDDLDALKQALSLARNTNADLRALIVCPEFPKALAKYREKYETSLAQQLNALIQTARETTGVSETEIPVPIDVESGSTRAVRIIGHVLRHGHDLVIKEAERKEGGVGFKAVDMELLRKCPCPVWLSRPINRHWREMKVAVAIDPQSPEPEGREPALRLLQLARSLADTCSGELNIVSCWDYP
ncbi:MAG: universal stress protein, partial [Telluria sp.]